jgi:proline iminopeptidase
MRTLFPAIEAHKTFRLRVSEVHELHVEEAGNPEGIPVIFVHGGPGGGINANYRRYHDPEKWRIILFDQRGAGKSTPHAELSENTTWDLVADMEKIREHLGIEKWHLFGGSWGSTLSLSYAAKYPERVASLVLRGIFLLREREIRWFYQHGASEIFPDAWEGYLAPIPEAERQDLVAAYHRRLTSGDAEVEAEAAKAWSIWEGSTSKLEPDPMLIAQVGGDVFSRAFARIECHYFINKGFMEKDGWLLEQVPRFRHLPCTIVQGRYDVVCPVRSAWDLHRAWPEANLQIIGTAGHSASEPGIIDALVQATDHHAGLRKA